MAKDIFSRIEKDISKVEKKLQTAAEEIAKLFYDTLIENISTNAFGFQISDVTSRLRMAYGSNSTIPMVDSGEYLKAIIIEGYKVMVKKGTHKGGLSYEELSWILEYGRRDKHTPPFPVWKMTYDQIKPQMQEIIDKHLKTKLSGKP